MGLYHEILEQPQVLTGLLKSRPAVEEVCAALARRTYPYVMLVARGSSDHPGLYAKYLLGAANHLPVALAAPSLFTQYQTPPNVKDALVIGISQSGATEDVVSVVRGPRAGGGEGAPPARKPYPARPLASRSRGSGSSPQPEEPKITFP